MTDFQYAILFFVVIPGVIFHFAMLADIASGIRRLGDKMDSLGHDIRSKK